MALHRGKAVPDKERPGPRITAFPSSGNLPILDNKALTDRLSWSSDLPRLEIRQIAVSQCKITDM